MIDCRCGYRAADMDDLRRHITSWSNWAAETGRDNSDFHAED